jgi:hypothetical protein
MRRWADEKYIGAGTDPSALSYARGRLVVASTAAGLPAPIDGPTLTADNITLLEALKVPDPWEGTAPALVDTRGVQFQAACAV